MVSPKFDFRAMEYDPDELVKAGRTVILQASSRHLGLGGTEVTEDPCLVYGDRPRGMTLSRLAARFLSRFAWYRPRKREEEGPGPGGLPGPNLDAAWAHYEHWTLARYYTDVGGGWGGRMDRAEAGELARPTALYPVWGTPLKELTTFGISVRLYFTMVLALSGFLLAAGILNIPLILYFESYGKKDDIPFGIVSSAICDDTEWVECESCNERPWKYPAYRLDGENVLRNICDFENWLIPGLFSYIATIVLLVLWVWFYYWLRRAETAFDEDVQTASDYSIKITNPPSDAMDPEEWRAFFSRFTDRHRDGGGVAVCTIALDNAELVRALTKRRRLLKKLSESLPPKTDMANDSAVADAVEETPARRSFFVSMFSPDARKQYSKVKSLEGKIKELAQRDYSVVAVFVTFETERAQRNALHTLSTGRVNICLNRSDTFKSKGNMIEVHERADDATADILQPFSFMNDETEAHNIRLTTSKDSMRSVADYLLFRGWKVLGIRESVEPNNVRWQDLQVSSVIRLVKHVGATLVLIAFMAWSGFFIKRLVRSHPGTPYATFFIAITNGVIPEICKKINGFESHSTEGNRQRSLYIKIALFRWFNSAIALSIISNFIETISVEDGNEKEKESLIYSVFPIIAAEIFAGPIIKLLDIKENFHKHILAPRARDQHEMNSYFIGGDCELADLYTDATKVVFVALFYSSIFPGVLFLGALALVVQFCTAKFCLLRLWRAAPDLGTHLAWLSRNYFFSTAMITHVVMSAYWWSGYPYDKVCSDGGDDDDGGYYFCSQDLFRHALPPLPRFQDFQVEGNRWMTDSQEILTSLYGWTSLIVLGCAAAVFLGKVVYPKLVHLFRSPYEPNGKDQSIPFSEVKHLHEFRGYIPQSHELGFSHPLLAADLRGIDEDLVGWRDDFNGLGSHNLFNDACQIIGCEPVKPVFSTVKQWRPKKRAT